MTDQFKNAIIGMFVFAALAIVVFIILFLHPSPGDEGQVIYARFTDLDKINVGTRVTLAGKAVGEVAEIKIVKDAREGPKDENGHYYIYELKLLIDSGIKVYDTDLITTRTSGLLGEKSVAIIPQTPEPGKVPKLVTSKDILYASQPGNVEEAMAQIKTVSEKVGRALDNVSGVIDEIRTEQLVKKIADTAQNLKEITAALNQPEDLTAIITNLQVFTSELATRLPVSWDIFDDSLKGFDEVVKRVNRGEGSAGRLLAKDDFYLQLTSLLSKGETVFDDINHYGLLYSTDKGWQRLRARRLNLLQKLQSPQEFRNYFNDEIDQITASLSRVGMVLDNAEANCEFPLQADPEFAKVFAELLRRVTRMEEALKMYNQQVIDKTVCEKTELTEKR